MSLVYRDGILIAEWLYKNSRDMHAAASADAVSANMLWLHSDREKLQNLSDSIALFLTPVDKSITLIE